MQDVPTKEGVLEMMKDVVAFEDKYDAGVQVDTLIINNDAGFKEGNDYIESLHGTRTRNGVIKTITRPFLGWSFGGYNLAVQSFSDYEFYLFTEDDILVGGDGYYKKLIERWVALENLNTQPGFLALVNVVNHAYGLHCGGGVGLTTNKILTKLITRHGSLPHYNRLDNSNHTWEQRREKHILDGEVAFTNKIFGLGFNLFNYGPNVSWDLENNLCTPYFNYKHGI
jgi:hypothetical protein